MTSQKGQSTNDYRSKHYELYLRLVTFQNDVCDMFFNFSDNHGKISLVPSTLFTRWIC